MAEQPDDYPWSMAANVTVDSIDRAFLWQTVRNRILVGHEHDRQGRCYICGHPTDHNGEPHAVVTGDGVDRLTWVTLGGLT